MTAVILVWDPLGPRSAIPARILPGGVTCAHVVVGMRAAGHVAQAAGRRRALAAVVLGLALRRLGAGAVGAPPPDAPVSHGQKRSASGQHVGASAPPAVPPPGAPASPEPRGAPASPARAAPPRRFPPGSPDRISRSCAELPPTPPRAPQGPPPRALAPPPPPRDTVFYDDRGLDDATGPALLDGALLRVSGREQAPVGRLSVSESGGESGGEDLELDGLVASIIAGPGDVAYGPAPAARWAEARPAQGGAPAGMPVPPHPAHVDGHYPDAGRARVMPRGPGRQGLAHAGSCGDLPAASDAAGREGPPAARPPRPPAPRPRGASPPPAAVAPVPEPTPGPVRGARASLLGVALTLAGRGDPRQGRGPCPKDAEAPAPASAPADPGAPDPRPTDAPLGLLRDALVRAKGWAAGWVPGGVREAGMGLWDDGGAARAPSPSARWARVGLAEACPNRPSSRGAAARAASSADWHSAWPLAGAHAAPRFHPRRASDGMGEPASPCSAAAAAHRRKLSECSTPALRGVRFAVHVEVPPLATAGDGAGCWGDGE